MNTHRILLGSQWSSWAFDHPEFFDETFWNFMKRSNSAVLHSAIEVTVHSLR